MTAFACAGRRCEQMYTGRSVRRILQPAALVTLLLFGLIPAAGAVCQWACAVPAADPSHAHHHAAADAAKSPSAVPVQFVADSRGCFHLDAAVAVTSASTRTLDVACAPAVVAGALTYSDGPSTAARPTTSPPGRFVTIFSLRI